MEQTQTRKGPQAGMNKRKRKLRKGAKGHMKSSKGRHDKAQRQARKGANTDRKRSKGS